MNYSRVRLTGAASWVRVAVTSLLVASGVMTIAASRERWSPACGSWEAPACLEVQDHRYDYLPPLAPWSPIGEAAHYAAVAEVLLAVAVLVLPWLLFRGRPMISRAVGAVTSLCLLVIALSTWASAQAGEAVMTPALLPALGIWALAWPLALIVLALLPRPLPLRTPDRPRRGCRILVLLALLTAGPLPQGLLAVGPYDAAPWVDASAGCLILLAGCALWPATAPARKASSVLEVGQASVPVTAGP